MHLRATFEAGIRRSVAGAAVGSTLPKATLDWVYLVLTTKLKPFAPSQRVGAGPEITPKPWLFRYVPA
jgi:hypothetical protein